jgi:hypothetical protein
MVAKATDARACSSGEALDESKAYRFDSKMASR